MVKFGAYLEQAGVNYEMVKRTTLECERQGFDSVWISDHLQDIGSPASSYLECWTLLSALAEATSRIRLGSIVICNLFRPPSLMAKMAATLDNVSKGRVEFGIGAGWYEPECTSHGIVFPKASTRIEQLEESLEVMKKLWTEQRTTYNGKFFSLREAYSSPKPIQKPHPPIWVGIMKGRKRMLKTVAKYADAWTISSLYLPTPQEYKGMLEDVGNYCREAGRSLESIRKGLGIGCVVAKDEQTLEEKVKKYKPSSLNMGEYVAKQIRVEGTPERCITKLREYVDLGATHLLMNFPDVDTLESIKLFGEKVIPAFK